MRQWVTDKLWGNVNVIYYIKQEVPSSLKGKTTASHLWAFSLAVVSTVLCWGTQPTTGRTRPAGGQKSALSRGGSSPSSIKRLNPVRNFCFDAIFLNAKLNAMYLLLVMIMMFQLTVTGAPGRPGLGAVLSVEVSSSGLGSAMTLVLPMEAFPVLEIRLKRGTATEALSVQVCSDHTYLPFPFRFKWFGIEWH